MPTDRHDAPVVPSPATPPEPAHARAARLEARLAVYAQYAAVVAEQAAATVDGDAARAAVLAAERERVAEHFTELQGAPAADGSAPAAGAATFRAALDEALAELAHQGAVDVALAQRLVTLRDAVVRGAAWATGGGRAGAGAGPARPARPGVVGWCGGGRARAAGSDGARPAALADALDRAALDNALVAARVAQVGGPLGGRYPGRGGRDEWPAGWGPDALAAEPGAGAARLDVRF
jgi:hypothetical protein